MLQEFKHYFKLAKMKQEQKFEGIGWTDQDINDDLINNIPIYDVIHRRYAAFCSFPEALHRKHKDPKGNGKQFETASVPKEDFLFMCYLFRLCGSGINYKSDHGFGNFWIVDAIKRGYYRRERWFDLLPERKFSDNKGYLLPQFSITLRRFILEFSYPLFTHMMENLRNGGMDIPELVECGNGYLRLMGFKRQNFVLTAWAMDIAEYTDLISRDSQVLVGTNAQKCLKLIFDKQRIDANECLDILIQETGGYNKKIDMEDVACDFIRYIENFQSPDHIKLNKGIVYENSLRALL